MREYTNRLILLRGIPGAGKTEFARTFLKDAVLVEADQYFTAEEYDSVTGHKAAGEYRFRPEELTIAHEWCKSMTEKYLARGKNVVVANTFSRQWELQPYIDMAKAEGHRFYVLTVHGDHGSVHGVPRQVVDKMKDRWEPDPVL